jgi:O-acetylhomoserine (thiol)-lyase
MDEPEDRQWGIRTRAVHAGARPDPTTGARAVPIYQTTSFVFEDVKDAADLFALQKYGNIYTRLGNPTVAALEERVASLEGGIGAVATGSGQAAETLLFTSVASAGEHIVASSALYGGTYTLLDVTLRRLGIETTFVAPDDPAAFAAAVQPGRTKLVYTEIIANPAGTIADLEALAAVAGAAGVPLAVDATLASPYLCRPIEHGADIIVHSATKFLGGHGNSMGGVIVESGRFPWDNGNFPVMTEPVATYGNLCFWDNFGEYGFCTKLRVEGLRNLGGVLSPLNAFLILQGIETLPLRMEAHVANTQAVAEFLLADDRVSWVSYAGLPDDPGHELARKYMPRGPGAVLSFGLRGGRAAGEAFIGAVELCSHLANIGDTRTLVIHPASTTHRQLSDEALRAAGVAGELVRISVGIEDVDDILYDLDRALAAADRTESGSAAVPT